MRNSRGRSRSRVIRTTDHTNPIIDSTCGEVRVRGTLVQVIEKYDALTKEAIDDVAKERYKQQVEHFTRMQNKLKAEKDLGHV